MDESLIDKSYSSFSKNSFIQLIIIIKKFNNRGIIKLNYNEFNKIK